MLVTGDGTRGGQITPLYADIGGVLTASGVGLSLT
jgi:hypothetical protein